LAAASPVNSSGLAQMQHANRMAPQIEMPRDDKSVASVVSLAATNHHRPDDSQVTEHVRRRPARRLHQNQPAQKPNSSTARLIDASRTAREEDERSMIEHPRLTVRQPRRKTWLF